MPMRPCLLAVLLLAAWPAALARADVVHLKSGQRIEGKILEEAPDKVVLKTKFGVDMTLERAKIERIEYKRQPREELAARVAAAGDDPQKLYAAAEYAGEQKLDRERRELLEKVLALDASHPGANEALGRVQYQGAWYTPEELVAAKEREAVRMKAAGKMLYEGRWVDEAHAMRRQGYEQYAGEWRTWREIYRLQAEEKMPELLGVRLDLVESEHFMLWSKLPEETAREIVDLLERGYVHFSAVFGPNDVEHEIMTFYPIAVYVLPEVALVEPFAREGGYMDQLYNPPKGVHERYVDVHSFPIFFPRPVIVVSEGPHNRGGDSRLTGLIGFLTHYEGNLLVRRFKRAGRIPGWVEAGLSHHYEGVLNDFRTLSITEYRGYEHVEKWEKGIETWLGWYESIARPDFRASLPSFCAIREKPVEELTARELVKSYFLVRWLLETRQDAFVQYVREVYAPLPGSKVTPPEEDVFARAFGVECSELEREFEEWLATLPPRPPL